MLNMKKLLSVIVGALLMGTFHAEAAEIETAKEAVKNMGVGWNLGNTFDAWRDGGGDEGLRARAADISRFPVTGESRSRPNFDRLAGEMLVCGLVFVTTA